jgi:hypothetical protein
VSVRNVQVRQANCIPPVGPEAIHQASLRGARA